MEFFSSIAPHWIWLALALALFAVEVLALPSGYLLGIATAAGVMAVVAFFMPDLDWLWSCSLFSVLIVISSLVWWKFFRNRKNGADEAGKLGLNVRGERLIGHKGTLETPVRHGRGRLRVNDSFWPVAADEDYPAGTRVEVTAVEGITLRIKRVEDN